MPVNNGDDCCVRYFFLQSRTKKSLLSRTQTPIDEPEIRIIAQQSIDRGHLQVQVPQLQYALRELERNVQLVQIQILFQKTTQEAPQNVFVEPLYRQLGKPRSELHGWCMNLNDRTADGEIRYYV